MKVLMVGHYRLEGYPRGKVIYSGLKKNNVEVDVFVRGGKLKYPQIMRRVLRNDYDALIPTGILTLFVSKLACRKPVLFDAFISNYDSLVCDRAVVAKNSPKAKLLWLGDKYSCIFADRVIVDTEEHRDYFVKEFGLDARKFRSIPVSADEGIFHPMTGAGNQILRPEGRSMTYKPARCSIHLRPEGRSILPVCNNPTFNVTFIGSFIPLQGVEYIIKAAKLLGGEDIEFNIIGTGQTFREMKALSAKLNTRNVKFLGWKSYDELPSVMAKADICLGIFGITEKAKRVIPNKAYETIAMRKPLITGDTAAIRRFFHDGENCILCEIGNEKAIAEAILRLKKDPALREKIASNGYRLFKERFAAEAIGREVKEFISAALSP